ncbi:MAG: MCP four helix bundle domain-containing protein [Bacteroidota bacterium]
MEWKFSSAQRIRTALALLVVFLIVIATNMIDKNHFATVQKSVRTIYDDRMVAKNYIYKISRQLALKRGVLQSGNKENIIRLNSSYNDSIQSLIEKYGQTKLTEREVRRFQLLKDNLDRLYQSENFLEGEITLSTELSLPNEFELHFANVTEDLDTLAEIQMSEGRREKAISNRAVESSNLISKLEIGFVILIGFLIQILIFVKPLK